MNQHEEDSIFLKTLDEDQLICLILIKIIGITKEREMRDIMKRMIIYDNIFKNNTTFFNFPDMFRRYIRHRQCNG